IRFAPASWGTTLRERPAHGAERRSPPQHALLLLNSHSNCQLRASLRGTPNIGLVEIVSLEQQRHATIAGYSVGETIAEIELRRMTRSFAISRKSGESSLRIRGRNWNTFDSCDRKKFLHIGLRFVDACMPFSAKSQNSLENGYRGRDGHACLFEQIGKAIGFGLATQNGDDRRSIDEHQL